MLICISMHAGTGTLCTQEQACCSDNCLFGQRETNAVGISLKQVCSICGQ